MKLDAVGIRNRSNFFPADQPHALPEAVPETFFHNQPVQDVGKRHEDKHKYD